MSNKSTTPWLCFIQVFRSALEMRFADCGMSGEERKMDEDMSSRSRNQTWLSTVSFFRAASSGPSKAWQLKWAPWTSWGM
jgi:hypothetical protein